MNSMPVELRQSWHAQALERRLAPLLGAPTVEVLASADSTNSVLLERARQGARLPSLLVAEAQTAGRGRQGRQWQSSAGASLTFSFAYHPNATDWSGLSLAVGLSLAEALDPARPGASPRIGLKWPNDLLLEGGQGTPRKLGGILIESLPLRGSRVAVIGVGLNIAPLALDGLSLGYACVRELLPGAEAPQVLDRVAGPMLEMLQAFDGHGFAPLIARYSARDLLAGQAVGTTLAECPHGVADGVAEDGALWLRVGGQRRRVASGEVSVRAVVDPTGAGSRGC